jgi:hypothetical protein
MNVFRKGITQKQASVWLTLLAILVVTAPNANAKHRAAKSAEEPATVIAYLALPGASASQMVMQEHGDGQYLYVEQTSKEGFVIVNVTNPSQPRVINRGGWPNSAPTGRLQMISGELALAEGLEKDSVPATFGARTRTLEVLDLSDPANPRAVLSFSGVTSALQDEARHVVYIANGEGLWVLRNNRALAAAAERHKCDTGDAFNDVASCQ